MSVKSQECVIAVFEKRPYWGPELQRQFAQASIVIRECRTVGDLLPAIAGFETALMVMDLDSGLGDCLDWLGTNTVKDGIHCPIIACGSAATANLEWRLREIGVTAFLPDVISGNDFARLCRRQLGLAR